MFKARDYQQEAYEAGIAHARASDEPAILELGTAAGKSIIVAMLAHTVKKAGKRVLVLCPSGDLVVQNSEKFRALGEYCSIYSAKLGHKNVGHEVVFGTPISVANNLEDFDASYALMVVDECHTLGEDEESSYQKILAHLRSKNPKLRLIGLTATPSRGKHKLVSKKATFKHVAYAMPSHELSKRGWTVPFTLGVATEGYDLSKIKLGNNGKFKQSEVDDLTLEKERLTRSIVDNVMQIMASQGRKAAMFFTSSIKHAKEVLSYLPEAETAMIDGKTATGERARILEETKNGKWRYLVNVGTLTTGVDLPIVDTIVMMRRTESGALFLQILGRGCRLYCPNWKSEYGQMNWQSEHYDGKTDCLVLDYASNVDGFAMDDDLVLTGLTEARDRKDDDEEFFPIECPDCGHENRHTSQRCTGVSGDGERCSYRFIKKDCPVCEAHNSPSARDCYKCGATLIDPDDKLSRNPAIGSGMAFQVAVMSMTLRQHWKGESESLRVTYNVTDGDKSWKVNEFMKPTMWNWNRWAKETECAANTVEGAVAVAALLKVPTRLMVKKKKGSKYFDVCNRYYDADRNNQLERAA